MNRKKKEIRFITSAYDELFRIPDGGKIRIDFKNRSVSTECQYIDEFHFRMGEETYHICQFAEMMERISATVSPEKEEGQGTADADGKTEPV